MERDRELEQAMAFLKDMGIDIRPAEGGYDVWVRYRESPEAQVQPRAVAKVVAQKDGFEVMVVDVSVFWGPDWELHPDLIGCDSMDGVMQFLYESLAPRVNIKGNIEKSEV